MKAISNWILKKFIGGNHYTFAEVVHELNIELYERHMLAKSSGINRKQKQKLKKYDKISNAVN
jgi:hypothetical protein